MATTIDGLVEHPVRVRRGRGALYGDLSRNLQGGSAGGPNDGGAYLGGGGGIEVGAGGTIAIGGLGISADGEPATFPPSSFIGAGGGSGGGIFLHGAAVDVTGPLDAGGGNGAAGGIYEDQSYGAGGSGGGGRILIETAPGGFTGDPSAFGVSGAPPGVVTVEDLPGPIPVPAPAGGMMLATGLFAARGLDHASRRRHGPHPLDIRSAPRYHRRVGNRFVRGGTLLKDGRQTPEVSGIILKPTPTPIMIRECGDVVPGHGLLGPVSHDHGRSPALPYPGAGTGPAREPSEGRPVGIQSGQANPLAPGGHVARATTTAMTGEPARSTGSPHRG